MYRKKNFKRDTDDEDSDDEDSDEYSNHSEDDDQDHIASRNDYDEDLSDVFNSLNLNKTDQTKKQRNNRIRKNNESFTEDELNISVWKMIEDHTEEKIKSYLELSRCKKYKAPFKKGASHQDRKGRIDKEKKYDTSSSDGLKYCEQSQVMLKDCTDIDASHLMGINNDGFDKELINKISRTNPLPSCFNKGPEKTLENFLLDLINDWENWRDLNRSIKKFIDKITNTEKYPERIKSLYINNLERIEYRNGKLYYD
ncbi:hypothetical protein BpHYR1_014449 [Brachionus plicatilis]|uniref:Uncharacterized protein n=1 Tax=Brachionus plicatilis TaxID=10195 RepID=A0A3M7Q8A2_BRAPC|nr:hypothetical protein BpHYR1_014449 [Brachionus plicatilis]